MEIFIPSDERLVRKFFATHTVLEDIYPSIRFSDLTVLYYGLSSLFQKYATNKNYDLKIFDEEEFHYKFVMENKNNVKLLLSIFINKYKHVQEGILVWERDKSGKIDYINKISAEKFKKNDS
ncbi:hypothetical protein DMUE_0995 [Dictyocoela muelleri]|nr:hypothetical protein DMUE_0995 [Dictyocoela muelleri]